MRKGLGVSHMCPLHRVSSVAIKVLTGIMVSSQAKPTKDPFLQNPVFCDYRVEGFNLAGCC